MIDPSGFVPRIVKMSAELLAPNVGSPPDPRYAKDTLAWLATVPDAERGKLPSTGISRDREDKVLAAWNARG